MNRRSSGFSVQDEAELNPLSRLTRASTDDGNNLHPSHEFSEPSLSSPTARSSPGSLDLNRAPRSRNSSALRTSPSRATTPTTSSFTSKSSSSPSSRTPETMIPLGSQRLPMEGSPEALRSRYSRFRNPWSASLLAISVTLVGLVTLLSILHGFVNRSVGADGCGVPVMSPTYIRMVGFDAEHTRFASKYNLFLYREEGVDPYTQDNIGLNGVPVLFLPGNAGSYRQVRSYAAEASRHYYDVVQHDQRRRQEGTRSLDFFMIDFNEDMAAFHGQTLLDQAEYVNEAIAYILSLYHEPHRSRRDPNLPDPSAVILIGHSMGGIVARTSLTMANYQANSVNTIVTMSAPHAKPPVSFDSDIVHTYKQINDYWRAAYSQEWANNNPLWHVTLISIAGGARDTIVPSDYTSLASLVPETHGFTVYGSTIPDVWVGMDHLSITWCDQFRKAIIKSLFEIVDVRRPSQTRPRAERMRIFKKWYLTGLEPVAERTLPQMDANTLLTLEANTNTILSTGERLILRDLGRRREPEAFLLPVPPQGVPGKKLTLLTNQEIGRSESSGNLEVLFCTLFPSQPGQTTALFSMNMDLSGGSPGSTRLACKNAADDRLHLPASTPSSRYAFDREPPFNYLQYDLEDLAEHNFVAVVDKADTPRGGWVLAEFSDSSDSLIPTRVGLGRLLSAGLHVRLPASRPMMTEVRIPALHSSLLTYRLSVRPQGDCATGGPLFAPLLRQSMPEPHESKFFVNVKDVIVNLHGVAPFVPPALRGQAAYGGISFQLWSDPSCGSSVDLSLKVDVLGSLGELVMRYRTIFTAFPLLIVALVLRKQFQLYNDTGYFIPFMESLNLCLRSSLPLSFLVLSLVASSIASSRRLPPLDDPLQWRTNATESAVDFTKNDLLLGAQDAFFWFLVPLFGLVSVGVCVLLHYAVLLLLTIFSLLYGIFRSKTGYIRRDDRENSPIFTSPTPRRRIINTIVLLLLVATVIPYQFAYIVACIVQVATCVRAQWHVRDTRLTVHASFYNYAHSILILMLWILPINILVLIVWIHNIAVHWLTPFSSHHNVLSIMPFLLLVETMTSGIMIPRVTSRLKHVTYILFFFIALYSALYGVSYAYLLHHLTNLLAAWLVGVYFTGANFSIRRFFRIIDGDENHLHSISATDGSHVKKKP